MPKKASDGVSDTTIGFLQAVVINFSKIGKRCLRVAVP